MLVSAPCKLLLIAYAAVFTVAAASAAGLSGGGGRQPAMGIPADRPDSLRADSVHRTHGIDRISVTVRRPSAIHSPVLGSIELGLTTIEKLPGLFGSADPMRTLQLMPGIQTTGEVSGGVYIRGSQSAHNLVELNGSRIYNPMHALGIFSVFNNDNLNSFTLHKSYIPARYGGQIGSVVSAGSKDRAPSRFSADGEIGLIASNLTLGIPFCQKSGIYISGRITYIDPVLKAIGGIGKMKTRLGYNMHDMNGTWVWQPSERDKVVVNAYRGRDRLKVDGMYESASNMNWGNTAGSAVWEHRFRRPLKLSQTIFATYYNNGIEIDHNSISLNMPSSMTDAGYKASVGNIGGRVAWESGVDYTFHHVKLQYPIFGNYFFSNNPPDPIHTHEAGLFAEASFNITGRLTARAGLRASMLLHTEGGRVRKAYWAPEPRLNFTMRVDDLSAFSLSGTIQQQYINQVTTSNTGFPTDFWLPASALVPPQRAYSAALGYSRETASKEYEFSAELYFKHLTEQMESLAGMIGNFNSKYDIYSGIVYGRGRNFGVEILLNKKYGRLTGWISYTLGWAQRSFPDIEDGRWFAMAYERRHDISVSAMYRIGDRWLVSSNFVFATGNAYTPSLGVYLVGEVPVNEYGPHNSARLPNYHRMDIAATYEIKSRRLPGRLTLSVYNLYARKNPIACYTYVEIKESDAVLKRRLSSLYSIIPSVSYSFNF